MFKLTTFFLMIGFLLPSSFSFAQRRRSINIAVEAKGTAADSTRFSYADVGLLGNITSLRGVNAQLFTYAIHNNASGLSVGVLGGLVGGNMNGVQIGSLFNMVGGRMNGVQLSGLPNLVAKDVNGVQLSVLGNFSGGVVKGLQLSMIGNVTKELKGWQVSAINNIATEQMKGTQICAAVNIAPVVNRGLQLAGAVNLCPDVMRGAQISTANYAGTLRGCQVGVLNLAGPRSSGFQIGLVNISSDSLMHKVGLVNVNQHTRIQMLLFGGNLGKGNVGVRFLNPHSYSICGINTYYMGFDTEFSGALFYRFGLHHAVTPRLRLSADAGYFHIETFEDDSSEKPERLYSLQLRGNVEYQLTSRLALFGSGGYAITRHYNRSADFSHKPLIEAGIILF